MKFKIDPQIFEKFPELNLGIVVAKQISNTGTSKELMELLKTEQNRIKSNFSTETLSQNPKIDAWRKAFSSFGAKPKKYKCSVENLYRMILEGIELRHINKLVDLYNYISLKHMIPVGGDDTDKVSGRIQLTIATGNEKFIQLNSDDVKNPKAGEVVYCDDEEILCRRWNWRDADATKVTEQTKNAVLFIDGLPPITRKKIEEIQVEIQDLIEAFCKAKVHTEIAHKDLDEVEF